MQIKINLHKNVPKMLSKSVKHNLIVVNSDKSNFLTESVIAKIKRLKLKLSDLEDKFLSLDDEYQAHTVILKSSDKSVFKVQTQLRKSLKNLLDENPTEINLIIETDNTLWNRELLYTALLNSKDLPSRKKKVDKKSLKVINFYGKLESADIKEIEALVEGNTLSRILTMTPPNDLTPTIYRKEIKRLASKSKWTFNEYTMPQLKKWGQVRLSPLVKGPNRKMPPLFI